VKPEDLESTATQGPRSSNGLAGHRTAATHAGAAPTHRPPDAGAAARVARTDSESAARFKTAREGSRVARLKGYEGDPCPVCGHLTLVRNGTCLKCETCGSTTGCS